MMKLLFSFLAVFSFTACGQLIGIGENHGCIVTPDDTAFCLGDLGNQQTVESLGKVKGVACSGYSSCGIKKEDGTVWCFGFGYGDDRTKGRQQFDIPIKFITMPTLSDNGYVCGIREADDTAVCTGSFMFQDYDQNETLTKTKFKTIAAGDKGFCGITMHDDALLCYVYHSSSTPNNFVVFPLPGIAASAIALSGGRGCGIRLDDGCIFCFNIYLHVQYGYDIIDPVASSTRPTECGFVSISLALEVACAQRSNGTATCWLPYPELRSPARTQIMSVQYHLPHWQWAGDTTFKRGTVAVGGVACGIPESADSSNVLTCWGDHFTLWWSGATGTYADEEHNPFFQTWPECTSIGTLYNGASTCNNGLYIQEYALAQTEEEVAEHNTPAAWKNPHGPACPKVQWQRVHKCVFGGSKQMACKLEFDGMDECMNDLGCWEEYVRIINSTSLTHDFYHAGDAVGLKGVTPMMTCVYSVSVGYQCVSKESFPAAGWAPPEFNYTSTYTLVQGHSVSGSYVECSVDGAGNVVQDRTTNDKSVAKVYGKGNELLQMCESRCSKCNACVGFTFDRDDGFCVFKSSSETKSSYSKDWYLKPVGSTPVGAAGSTPVGAADSSSAAPSSRSLTTSLLAASSETAAQGVASVAPSSRSFTHPIVGFILALATTHI